MTLKEIRQRKRRIEKEEISKRLRKAYESSGLSINEIARITSVNYHTLTAWFCGSRTPNKEKAERVISQIERYFERDGKCEYIDKNACRTLFIDRVYNAFRTLKPEQLGKAVIDIYDALPTVTKNAVEKKKDKKGE